MDGIKLTSVTRRTILKALRYRGIDSVTGMKHYYAGSVVATLTNFQMFSGKQVTHDFDNDRIPAGIVPSRHNDIPRMYCYQLRGALYDLLLDILYESIDTNDLAAECTILITWDIPNDCITITATKYRYQVESEKIIRL